MARRDLLIGIADKPSDAARVKQLFGVDPFIFRSFRVIGIDHEAKAQGKSLDQYFQFIVGKIGARLAEPLKTATLRDIKLVGYHGRHVLVIEITGQEDPSHIDGRYFVRSGNSLNEIKPSDLVAFIRGFPRSQAA